ncbi:AMP-dependent synthetase and ligase [Thioalkalivibrio nitratireducens DSM 14787]|uniref:AMP-dependent synthetase and ligase n=1 Tax=Thioalkalivibrio nitratireducens (strain DSM 14787 / UNIQEM 213 / ALEN2) TaxID=1255043 RepID=L0DT38_THIND|nr:MFS transporter [Thioalkalivibrio nitratireducens]AGA32774.1 AMP-dependent synthetase and ligase [Thioalkalivibrio nitratireducens DSM 14787]
MAGSSDIRTNGFAALMITVFINALNDNFFRLVFIFLALRVYVADGNGTFYYSLIGFIFLLPFVLFSPYAGYVGDRFSKKAVIVGTRVAEAVVLMTAALMLTLHHMPGLFVALFLMGLQSTFFSPVKFGILPEIVREEELSRANGHMQLWTFLAIILGTALAGFIMEWARDALWIPATVIVLLSLVGLVSSLFVPHTRAGGDPAPFRLNAFADVAAAIGEIRRFRVLFLVVTGIAWFWALGTLYQLNVPMFAELQLQVGEMRTGIILTLLAVGIGVGSILAGHLAGGRIEMRHVPAGMLAAGVFSVLLFLAGDSYAATLVLSFLLGIGAGFFIVPISAYLQNESPARRRARFIAASNFLAFSAMLVAPVLFWILTGPLGAKPGHIFVISGLASVLVGVYTVHLAWRGSLEDDS